MRRDVRPILAQRCLKCHGPDEQKSGLRLDTVASMLAGGNAGAAVVRGKSCESLLIKAVSGAEDVSSMPPEDAGPRLSSAEIATLSRWIDAAPAPANEEPVPAATRRKSDHWSFQPITRPEPPAVPATQVANISRIRNPIDAFIVGRLADAGIAPAPEADRVTLVRRLSLDLLGLLPTVAEVESFRRRHATRTLTSSWSIGYWPRRITASGKPGTGSTWPAMPTATAIRTIIRA